jgi:hypothetical protein
MLNAQNFGYRERFSERLRHDFRDITVGKEVSLIPVFPREMETIIRLAMEVRMLADQASTLTVYQLAL